MRVLSFIVLSLTVALGLAIPSANPESEKRAAATAQGVITNLQTTANTITPKINTLVANGQANDATVEPLLSNLILAFTTASSALATVQSRDIESRQVGSAVASVAAGIISSVSLSLAGLLPLISGIPILGPLLITIDTALNEVLLALSVIFIAIGTIIDGLLGTVIGVIESLGLVLVLGTLGL